MFAYVWEQIWTVASEHVCEGQKWKSASSSITAHFIYRAGFSLSPEFANLAILSSQCALGIPSWPPKDLDYIQVGHHTAKLLM